jgi:hypothetical protein|tara:strand:+ start:306 stop:491 length:186 start_codon:yes stop_codon:yes gene_type:complete
MDEIKVNWLIKYCSQETRIAILYDEIRLWEKRLSDSPDDIPYLGYIRTTMKERVKELENDL